MTLIGRPAIGRLHRIAEWYFDRIYGQVEGPGIIPFYCDPARVGHFAVPPSALARGDHDALFRLLVGLSMFQARRDRLLMTLQRSIPRATVLELTAPNTIRRRVEECECRWLRGEDALARSCSVFKADGVVDCREHPKRDCPVKTATVAMRRMGDMGKLPVSAWLVFGERGGFRELIASVAEVSNDQHERAAAVISRIRTVWRVGEKLANLFVSVLSTPALAPGLTPWHPVLDGNQLVVIDTNVVRVIEQLRASGGRTYASYAEWLRFAAAQVALSDFVAGVPRYSPRVLQQALYYFGSSSNRRILGLACTGDRSCASCAPASCLEQRAAA